jgi:site-specific DNA recombinase
MHPEMATSFIEEFHKELNRQRAEQHGLRDRTARELEKAEREIRRVIEAIKARVPGAAVKEEMASLEARRIELPERFEAAPRPMPRLHPNVWRAGLTQRLFELTQAPGLQAESV